MPIALHQRLMKCPRITRRLGNLVVHAGNWLAMPNLLPQDECLCRDPIGWNHQIPGCVLRFINASRQVITRFSTRVYKTTLPRLLLKLRCVRGYVRKRAPLIGSQCYSNKPLGSHGTIGIERISRLIGALRFRIKQAFINRSQCRKLGVLTPVDDHWSALPAQEHGLPHLHLADINYFAWNRRYTLRAISKRREKNVEDREYAHVNHCLNGYPKFESSLLCFCCRLFHGLGFLQYSLFSVRYS
ncbi:MAG: hypothetical protein ACI8UP_005409 [Porticoccaceae bacterium]|jgi:hypothetical protein